MVSNLVGPTSNSKRCSSCSRRRRSRSICGKGSVGGSREVTPADDEEEYWDVERDWPSEEEEEGAVDPGAETKGESDGESNGSAVDLGSLIGVERAAEIWAAVEEEWKGSWRAVKMCDGVDEER